MRNVVEIQLSPRRCLIRISRNIFTCFRRFLERWAMGSKRELPGQVRQEGHILKSSLRASCTVSGEVEAVAGRKTVVPGLRHLVGRHHVGAVPHHKQSPSGSAARSRSTSTPSSPITSIRHPSFVSAVRAHSGRVVAATQRCPGAAHTVAGAHVPCYVVGVPRKGDADRAFRTRCFLPLWFGVFLFRKRHTRSDCANGLRGAFSNTEGVRNPFAFEKDSFDWAGIRPLIE